MANALQIAGSQGSKPTRYAPILIHKFFKGLWTQRNPFTDAGTPFLVEKFYSGTSFDGLIDGLNVELTNKLTLKRRCGSTVYNSQTFSTINRFYEFRTNTTGAEQIHVMADTGSTVYDATGPSTKTAIFAKSTNGQTSFVSVGNTLYGGDGVSNWEWIVAQPWAAASAFSVSTVVLDSNNNLQTATSAIRTPFQVSVTANVLEVDFNGVLSFLQLSQLPGTQVTFQNFVGASFLNGLTLTIQSVTTTVSPNRWHLFFSFTHANYGPTADTGYITDPQVWASGISAGSVPTWGTNPGDTVTDSQIIWTCKGPSVQNAGIVAPTVAPTVASIPAVSGLPSWVASTYFWPASGAFILDSNGNIQQLTTSGTTAASVPTWATGVGVTTTDGTAVWTCRGTATRATSHSYNVGDMIAVNWTVTTTQGPFGPPGSQFYVYTTYNYKYFFQCVTAGASSGSATASIPWSPTIGGKSADGAAVWQNVGQQVTRTTSATASPSTSGTQTGGGGSNIFVTINTVAGNVGNTAKVSNVMQVTGTTNGIAFNTALAGLSGSTEPTWNVAIGASTNDGGVQWISAGPVTAANTANWLYGFTFKKSITKEVSNMSPFSSPILLPASSWVGVSGTGSPDTGVDTIQVYRTPQGGSIPLLLAEIPAPLNSAPWSYQDQANPDTNLNFEVIAPQNFANNPPPAGFIPDCYHLGRIFGHVGVVLYYSNGPDTLVGNGNTCFPPLNTFVMPSNITRIVPLAIGALIFTTSGVYFSGIGGANLDFPTQPVPFLDGKIAGLMSPNALDIVGSTIYLVNSKKKLLEIDIGAGSQEIGFPIGDVLANGNPNNALGAVNPASCYVAWHEQDSTDSALYLAMPGSTAAAWWYRMNPAPAPENGIMWSSQAVSQSGFSAMQSIETSPGVHQLLMGPPAATGPILKRDTTTFADNGTAYVPYADIGSVVLAHPGQVAILDFISTFCVAVGSRPTVKVLLGEIGGHAEMLVKGATLSLGVPEPPENGPASATTLYNDRWWLSASQQSALCQHLQIEISWPAENQPNELLTYALFGAHYQEL